MAPQQAGLAAAALTERPWWVAYTQVQIRSCSGGHGACSPLRPLALACRRPPPCPPSLYSCSLGLFLCVQISSSFEDTGQPGGGPKHRLILTQLPL